MRRPRGFLENERAEIDPRPVDERVEDFGHVRRDMPEDATRRQAVRCMDCGVPFCTTGCPLGNVIPDFNGLVWEGRWREAIARLHSTNNFPEFTGLVCPAPCEAACVLGINDASVSIKRLEWEIVRQAWAAGWIMPRPSDENTGHSVGIVGSGPAGLAAAQQLARGGHEVTVYEREADPGGLLRFGIPDFKLEKWILDRRLAQLEAEGVRFRTEVEIGVDLSADDLRATHDAILLATGCEVPRPAPVRGAGLEGVHFAMDFLTQSNRRVAGLPLQTREIRAEDKTVVVLGGGDTGSDCVGTAHRQGATRVISLELAERPPSTRDPSTPWPEWPLVFRTSSSHAEGGERRFAVLAKELLADEAGRLRGLRGIRVQWDRVPGGRRRPKEIPGTDFEIECELLLIAIGFTHPVQAGVLVQLGVELDGRGCVEATSTDFATSQSGVFAAGDCRRGQSLVVHAIWEGREAARQIDAWLMGSTVLPSRDRE